MPSNPPASVKLEWEAATNNVAAITNYFVYYGEGSRQYEAKVNTGTNLNCTVYGLTRGTLYFFAVTSQDESGLESNFSGEISVQPNYIPSPPRIKSVTIQ